MHLSKLNIERVRIFFFATIICVIALLGIIFTSIYKTLVDRNKLVESNQEILYESEQVLSITKDIQIETRSFILSPAEPINTFLHDSKKSAFQLLDKLQSLTLENAPQQLRLEKLKHLIEKQVDFSYLIIHEVTKGDLPETLRLAQNKEGKTLMNNITTLIDEFQQEENKLLTQKNEAEIKKSESMNRIFSLLLISAIIFLAISFVIFVTHNKYKKKVEESINQMNQDLEQLVEEKAREITETEKRYSFVLETIRESIQIIGFDWQYLYANGASKKQAKPHTEFVGHTIMDLNPGFENTPLFKVLNQCMAGRKVGWMENEIRNPDQSISYYEHFIEPVPEGLLILSIDITERKLNDKRRTEYIKSMQETLFIISHKVRQPIANILGLINLIDYDDDISNQKFTFDYLKESALRLDILTKDLNDFVQKNKESVA